MSSKFSVKNFSTDQKTLDRAAEALRSYLIIGFIWTIGCSLVLFSSYGMFGLITGIGFNLLMILWITISYKVAFKEAAKENNLNVPSIFSSPSLY